MSLPKPPPVPSIAFSQDLSNGVVVNGGELSKGFITPKKEKEVHFFQRRSHGNPIHKCGSPSIVGIMVGSKEKIELWLRENGPGSSCLWAEIDNFSPNPWGKAPSSQLKLIYRLHSENITSLSILNGTMVEISPPKGSQKDRGALRKAQSLKNCLQGSSTTVQSELLSSPSNASTNSTQEGSQDNDTNVWLAENKKAIHLLMPETTYRQLVTMACPRGILQEYQELLRRFVVNSNFLDGDFQLVDLQKWLKHHPFAVFLGGSSILVVRRGDGPSSIKWVVLKFDFGYGVVKSKIGDDLEDLELYFGNKDINQGFGTQVSWWGQTILSSRDKAQERYLRENTNDLDWKIWTVPIEDGGSWEGPLMWLLLDTLGIVNNLSLAETKSFKSLFYSPSWQVDCQAPTTIKVIETVFAVGRSSRMSWKEQCALSQLKSNFEELKGRGLHVLLDLLLVQRSKESPVLKELKPRSLDSNHHTGCYDKVSKLEIQVKEQIENVDIQEDNSQDKHEVEPFHILDWLNCGFLEVLLERTMVKGGDRKGEGIGTIGLLDFEVALEACLRIIELVPKEGSSHLAKVLIGLVQETFKDFTKMNINLKFNKQCEINSQREVHSRQVEGRPFHSERIVRPNTKKTRTNLQDVFKKLLRFCKLMSLLASQSPLVGGPFAELGGLDLILDLYFCIVKRFPINVRFGVLSNASGLCKSLEKILPGETVKSQGTPLKVLPCILPRACITGVAQACLMDHCMLPNVEKEDLSWPPTPNWRESYPFKNIWIDNHLSANEKPDDNFQEKNNIVAKPSRQACECELVVPVPKLVDSHGLGQSTQNTFTLEFNSECSNSFGKASSARNSGPVINQTSKDSSNPDGTTVFHKPTQTRPFVPPLPLSNLRMSTSSFGLLITESPEAKALHSLRAQHSSCKVSSNIQPLTSEFDILTTVFNAKFELLQTMILLFSNSSRSCHLSRNKLLQKFQKEDEDYLALQFLPDIINGLIRVVPKNTRRRTKEKLFEVLSLLERGEVSNAIKRTPTLPKDTMDEVPTIPSKVPQGLPISSRPKRLIDILLHDLGERLRTVLCHLTTMPTMSPKSAEEAVNCHEQLYVTMGALKYSDPLFENHTISNGHLLNLWVDVGLLLRALVDFVVMWPEGESVQRVLSSCGKELENVMSLLAEYSSKSIWRFAQSLTMEHFLKLLTVCMKSSLNENRPDFQIWSAIDTFFWQLLFVKDLNWNCVKNFTTWAVTESCQTCFKKLFKGYQKTLWEPLEIYYSMLGEKIGENLAKEATENTLHGVDMLRSLFAFLRVTILMMKKRLQCESQITQTCPIMERLLFLLDFLMNPMEGILMHIIRSPIPCTKVTTTQREFEALNLLGKEERSCVNSSYERTLLDHIDINHLYSNQANCRKCPTTPCASNCAQNFPSYLKKESLGILADVFSLKYCGHHNEVPNPFVQPRGQNPFVFRKYATPFLDIIFFYFLNSYNKNSESSELSTTSPLPQCISRHSTTSINTGQQYTLTRDGSSTHDTSLTRNDEGDVICKDLNEEDKVPLVACMAYGQVLRALAQNQTEDVNQSFQQIRVMKFLVHQISLEYEISQVVTPRDVALPKDGFPTKVPLQDLQGCDLQGHEVGTSIAGLLWTGERSTAVLPCEREDLYPIKSIVEKNDGQEQKMKAGVTRAIGKTLFMKQSIGPVEVLSKESPTSLRSLRDPTSSADGHANLCTRELMNELFSKTTMLSGQQNDINNKFKKSRVIESKILNAHASSQAEGEVKSKWTLEDIEENVITRVRPHSEQDGATNSNNDLAKVSNEDPVAFHRAQHSADRGEIKGGEILTTVRYSGRFFDLNEEVERELAQERFSQAKHISSQEFDQLAQITNLDILDDIQEEGQLQDFGPKLIESEGRTDASYTSCDSKSFLEVGVSTLLEQKASRPAIPRLNLSKSIRKGGPTIKSDASMNFEFLPSATSPLDSKHRPGSISRLHRELQKEILSSDRGSKSWERGGNYKTGRLQRRLYRHAGLHVLLLELFVSLMLTPHKRMKDFKPAAFRILKLCWRALFNPKIYTSRVQIARGATSKVYAAKVKQKCSKPDGVKEDLVVLKVVDVPKGPYDPCKFFDVYSEVEILEKFSGEPAICQILDYGVDMESFILVLKQYKCSLHTWRQGDRDKADNELFSPTEIRRVVPKFVLGRLPLYLEVYSAILQAVKKLEIKNVVHYDLKCDNILLESLDSVGLDSEFWTPRWPPKDPSKPLPFRICIADFGQSKASTHLGGECTMRNRGTEYVKSPEMLKLLSSQSQRDSDFNLRTTDEGVGKAVDVWSLGCLLYELLTGEYLFYDEDWLQFFMRVTMPSEELISKEKAGKLDNYGPVVDLLKFILVRDPLQRPSLDEVAICVEQLQLKLEAQALAAVHNGSENPTTLHQSLVENSSDTQASDSDEETSFETNFRLDRFERKSHGLQYNASDKFKHNSHIVDSLECLKGLLCHCQCGEE